MSFAFATKTIATFVQQVKNLVVFFLLKEDGFFLLLEDGGKIILESSDYTLQTKNIS